MLRFASGTDRNECADISFSSLKDLRYVDIIASSHYTQSRHGEGWTQDDVSVLGARNPAANYPRCEFLFREQRTGDSSSCGSFHNGL